MIQKQSLMLTRNLSRGCLKKITASTEEKALACGIQALTIATLQLLPKKNLWFSLHALKNFL